MPEYEWVNMVRYRAVSIQHWIITGDKIKVTNVGRQWQAIYIHHLHKAEVGIVCVVNPGFHTTQVVRNLGFTQEISIPVYIISAAMSSNQHLREAGQ